MSPQSSAKTRFIAGFCPRVNKKITVAGEKYGVTFPNLAVFTRFSDVHTVQKAARVGRLL
jgi:hypothetical protein